LLARVRAGLGRFKTEQAKTELFSFSNVNLDFKKFRAHKKDHPRSPEKAGGKPIQTGTHCQYHGSGLPLCRTPDTVV